MFVPEKGPEPLSCDPADYSSKKLSAEMINFLLSQKKEMSFDNQFKNPVWSYEELIDGTKKNKTG